MHIRCTLKLWVWSNLWWSSPTHPETTIKMLTPGKDLVIWQTDWTKSSTTSRPASVFLTKNNFRLVVLSIRAQSLLNLKLYKMKRHELKDYQKTIQDVLARSEDDQSSSDQGQNRTEQMSTPSPAGSEGSNCSKVTIVVNSCTVYEFS